MELAIQTKDLTVRFGNETIIDRISFAVKTGEVAAIIGPNGSGKSTLLRALLGLVPYTGEVQLLAHEPRDMYSNIGYVPQYLQFDRTFPLTVEEFMRLSKSRRIPLIKIRGALAELGMEKVVFQRLGELSGGQLQRVLVARAILNDPRLLFLDEPTSGTDMEGVRDFYDTITHLNKAHHTTVIMVSHEINMVYKYASQILCLNKELVCQGTPRKALTSKVLKKLYGDHMDLKGHKH